MKFNEFLQSTYIETNEKLQKSYSTFSHGKALATSELIAFQRSVYKYFNYGLLVIKYLLVSAKIMSPPKSVEQHIKEIQEKQVEDDKKAAEQPSNVIPLKIKE